MGKEYNINIRVDEKLHQRVGKIDRASVRAYNDYMREQALYFAENEPYLVAAYKQKQADEKQRQKKRSKTTSSTNTSKETVATDNALFTE